MFAFSGCQFFYGIHKRPSRTDWRELPRVAHQHVTFHIGASVEKGSKLILGEHRTLVNDYCAIIAATRCRAVCKVRAGLAIVATIAV